MWTTSAGGSGPSSRSRFGLRRPVEVLHDDPGPAVLLDDVEDPHGIRVVDGGDGTRLPQGAAGEPLALVAGDVRREVQLLDRDLAVQQLVIASPDDAHAAGADLLREHVAAGDHGGRRGHHAFPTRGCAGDHA